MALLSFQHLGCDVVGSSANSSLSFSVELKFGCQTEVTYFDFHLVVQEQITKLEISVDHPMGVEVLNGVADLDHIALDLQLGESLSPTQ